MIHGVVNSRLEAVVEYRIGWRGKEISLPVIIDTGFGEFLTLPQPIIESLGLPYYDSSAIKLADGRIVNVEVYHVNVHWDDQWRPAFVQATGGDVLGGMRLLSDQVLTVHAVPGGEVTIEPE